MCAVINSKFIKNGNWWQNGQLTPSTYSQRKRFDLCVKNQQKWNELAKNISVVNEN